MAKRKVAGKGRKGPGKPTRESYLRNAPEWALQNGPKLLVALNVWHDGKPPLIDQFPELRAALGLTRTPNRALTDAGTSAGLAGLDHMLDAARAAESDVRRGHVPKDEQRKARQAALAQFWGLLREWHLCPAAEGRGPRAAAEERFQYWGFADAAQALYIFNKVCIEDGHYLRAEGLEEEEEATGACCYVDDCQYGREEGEDLRMVYCEACKTWFHVECVLRLGDPYDPNERHHLAFNCSLCREAGATLAKYVPRSTVAVNMDCGFKAAEGRNEGALVPGSRETIKDEFVKGRLGSLSMNALYLELPAEGRVEVVMLRGYGVKPTVRAVERRFDDLRLYTFELGQGDLHSVATFRHSPAAAVLLPIGEAEGAFERTNGRGRRKTTMPLPEKLDLLCNNLRYHLAVNANIDLSREGGSGGGSSAVFLAKPTVFELGDELYGKQEMIGDHDDAAELRRIIAARRDEARADTARRRLELLQLLSGEGAPTEHKYDPPKEALSAYMLWSMQERKSDAYAGMKVPEAGRALGATWKTMDEAARAPWVEASKEDHARHAREMASDVPSPEFAREAAGSSGAAEKAGAKRTRPHATDGGDARFGGLSAKAWGKQRAP